MHPGNIFKQMNQWYLSKSRTIKQSWSKNINFHHVVKDHLVLKNDSQSLSILYGAWLP